MAKSGCSGGSPGGSLLDRVKEIIQSDLVGYYSKWIEFKKKSGKNWAANCPFHEDKNTPSLSVNIETGQYHCFGCNAGGNALGFYMAHYSVDAMTAAQNLAKEFGIEDSCHSEVGDETLLDEKDYAELAAQLGGGNGGGGNGSCGAATADTTPSDPTIGSGIGSNEGGSGSGDSVHPGSPGTTNPTPATQGTESKESVKTGQGTDAPKRGRPTGSTYWPRLDESVVADLHSKLTEKVYTYFESRKISRETVKSLQLGLWKDTWIVFPVRKGGKLYSLRFYKPATDLAPKEIRQLDAKTLGYSPVWLFPEPDPNQDTVIIFEGEPDCMCARSLGYNATTATGGAGTFREEFLPFFKDKKVFICYDIDSAGRIGAKAVAQKVLTVARETRVVRLTLDLDKYPHGDFNDYIAKEGHTKEDFDSLLETAEFRSKIEAELDVVEDDGRYHSIRTNKKGEVEYKQISDFVIRLVRRYSNINDKNTDRIIERGIVLIKNKIPSQVLTIKSENMVTPPKFKEFCLERGDYSFSGSDKDLVDLWKLVFDQDKDCKVIYRDNKWGLIEEKDKLWMFSNVAVKNCQIMMPGDDGVFWNGKVGYQYLSPNRSSKIYSQPTIGTKIEGSDKISQDLAMALYNNTGNLECHYGLGLVFGSVFYKEIRSAFGGYPILFVGGKARSGKTEYVGFLMKLFGLARHDNESIPSIKSTAGISRKLSYHSCIPVWFDEYRNGLHILKDLEGLFRSAYEGSGRTRGIQKDVGLIHDTVESPLIISGEEEPQDEALYSRLVIVNINAQTRHEEFHKEVLELSSLASSRILDLIVNADSIKEKLFSTISEFRTKLNEKFGGKAINARAVNNHATALGCYDVLVSNDRLLFEHIMKYGITQRLDQDNDIVEHNETRILAEFIKSIEISVASSEIKTQFYRISIKDNDIYYVWLPPLWEAWARKYKMTKGDNAPNLDVISTHIRGTNYFVGYKSSRIEKKTQSCYMLRYSRMPQSMKNWFEINTMDIKDDDD